jgi:type III pantothenate kinase
MILAIDCGNTRLKWGLRDGAAWRKTGAVPLAELSGLESGWRRIAAPDAIVICNVAGGAARKRIEKLLSRWRVAPVWVKPKRSECGVTNAYSDPGRLGADRWAALIGAWSLRRGPCLVVMAGTATTADILEGDGTFAGGAILPGLDLMRRSLADNTAGLPLAKGRFSEAPRNTADAIETGCLLAQAGAIERMLAGLRGGASCVLSGGAAQAIAERLRAPVRIVDNLVLEGAARIAAGSP